jgi:hypothetical protein
MPESIMKIALDESTPTLLASGQTTPLSLTVDATSVYWTDPGAGTAMKVPK